MPESIKIILLILATSVIIVVASHLSKEYFYGSSLIYSVSSSEDRKNLNAIPEKREVAKVDDSNCSGHIFYDYNMCLPWDDIESMSDGSGVLTFVRFNNGPTVFIYNPDSEGDVRSDLLRHFGEEKVTNFTEKQANELNLKAKETLGISSYNFFEIMLNSTFENHSFFTPFKENYSQLILILAKTQICRLSTGVYSKRIFKFQIEQLKGFQIKFSKYKENVFHDLYIFPNDSEYIKITIVGKENTVKQSEIDFIIRNIVKINNEDDNMVRP